MWLSQVIHKFPRKGQSESLYFIIKNPFRCTLFYLEYFVSRNCISLLLLIVLYWATIGQFDWRWSGRSVLDCRWRNTEESIPVSPHLTVLHTVETCTIGEAGTLQILEKEKPSISIKRLSPMDKRWQTSNAASWLVFLPSLDWVLQSKSHHLKLSERLPLPRRAHS